MICIDRNTAEYQTLLRQSGIPDNYLASICGKFQEMYNRLPFLDEIQESDSSKYLKELLNVKNDFVTLDKLQEFTGTSDITKSILYLNNTFRDQEVNIIPYSTTAKITFRRRPLLNPITTEYKEHNIIDNSSLLFEEMLCKLRDNYGIGVHILSSEDIPGTELENIPGVESAKAFIFNGEIYVNSDFGNINLPIAHEMMHILVGELRLNNPEMYFQMVQAMVNNPKFKLYAKIYKNRTLSDIAEELFVEEFANLISNKSSDLQNVPLEFKHELMYYAKRTLDTVLMGETSVKSIQDSKLFLLSLNELAEIVRSDFNKLESFGTDVHRILSNIKHDLMENNELKEECE